MKRILPHIWNVLVFLFIAFVAVLVVPKVREQLTAPRATPDMIAIGYVGIGVLIGVVLCAVSVTSFFWFRVPVWFRIFTAIIIAALVAGYFRVCSLYASSPHAFGNPVSGSELFTFFGTLAAFTFPLLVTGYGYLGLIQRIWHRSRNAS
jgi:hypothetical protein